MKTPYSRISSLFLFAIVSAAPRPLPAAQDMALPAAVTLDALVSEVFARNEESRFYEAEIEASRVERRAAGTLPSPELSVAAGRVRIKDAVRREGTAWSVSLRQTFEWPGRMALRKAIANGQIVLAELGLAQFRTDLAARVRTLALALHTAQQEEAAAREVAERFEALHDVLVQREPAGMTPALERRIIEANGLALQRRVSEAEIAGRMALIELNQLRGAPAGQPLRVASPALSFPPAPGFDRLLAAAHAENFELRAREAELAQQGLRVSLARTERHSSFSVGPYVAQERAGERETEIGLEASVPLPLWNRRAGDVAVAEIRQRQAETALLVARREIERRLAQHLARYEAKLAAMARWHPESAAEFQEAAALADRHYRLGAVPVATYVELQKQYLDAVSTLLQTRHEALEAAQELQRLTGIAVAPFVLTP